MQKIKTNRPNAQAIHALDDVCRDHLWREIISPPKIAPAVTGMPAFSGEENPMRIAAPADDFAQRPLAGAQAIGKPERIAVGRVEKVSTGTAERVVEAIQIIAN